MDDGISPGLLIALQILLALFLVFLNGVFVAAEFALIKVRPTRIAQLVSENDRRAVLAQKCISNIDIYLSVSQLGITMSSLGLGWLGEPVIAKLIQPLIFYFGFTSPAVVHSIAFVVAFTLVTLMHVVLGELVPKSLAIQRSESIALWLAAPMQMFYYLFYPIIIVFNGIATWILKIADIQRASEHEESHSGEELQMLVSESYEGGHLDKNEWRLLQNVFEFERKIAREVMVPRPEVVFLDKTDELEENIRLARQSGHTRFPLCDGGHDNVVGLVHIKDLFRIGAGASIDDVRRNIVLVPEGMHLDKLLREFQKNHQQMALVVDEYGGTAGIITMENVLEELVGEIQDEFDEEAPHIIAEEKGVFLVDGRMLLDEVARRYNIPLSEDEEYDTLGGFIFGRLEKKPKVGDVLELPGHTLEIAEVDGLRIRRVRLRIKREAHSSPPIQ